MEGNSLVCVSVFDREKMLKVGGKKKKRKERENERKKERKKDGKGKSTQTQLPGFEFALLRQMLASRS